MAKGWCRHWSAALAAELLLTDEDRQLVKRIVLAVIPDAEFRVFGSRATGRARPFSDLDLLILRPKRLNWEQRVALRDAFEASELPYCVDLVEAAALPLTMAEQLQREMVSI